MSAARARANRKLYHAAVLQRMLTAEMEREELPAGVLLEAVGESVRLQLLDAYGWFLLELAEVEELPGTPPHSVPALCAAWPQAEPLRGELVELQNLEQATSWLSELQAPPPATAGGASPPVTAGGTSPAGDTLNVVEAQWSASTLEQWYSGLSGLMERMSDSLDEW